MDVTLTSYELMTAAMTGVMRACASVRNGLKHAHGGERSAFWQTQIEGACGEAALAKALGVWWGMSVNTFKTQRDVGQQFEVRTTPYRDGKLIVHPGDSDMAIFWLVVGQAGRYRIAGWQRGIDCKAEIYWADPQGGRPAYFVPQDKLYAVDAYDRDIEGVRG